MSFDTQISFTEYTDGQALWFAFNSKNELLVTISRNVPLFEQQWAPDGLIRSNYLGTLNGTHCFCAEVEDSLKIPDTQFCEFRSLFGTIDEELYSLIGHASQIVTWDKNHQFCSKCGSKAESSDRVRAKVCTSCGFMNFPRISPSIIVAITRGDKLLMARSPHFRAGMYSVVAGFLEPGETLEDCVQREVMEEVGLEVTNIQYFGNQPWAFPHSLMVGFTADYAGGEIVIDPVEIEDAKWCTADSMPEDLPAESTIARELINSFLN